MNTYFKARLAKVTRLLKSRGKAAALFGSAPLVTRSNDTSYPYRQDSNFYYLTGSREQNLLLLISSESKTPVLLYQPETPLRRLWDGKRADPKALARALGIGAFESKDLNGDLRKRLDGHEFFYYQNTVASFPRNFADNLLNNSAANSVRMPRHCAPVDTLMEQLRLIKDRQEIEEIRIANDITADSILDVVREMRPGIFEWQIARELETQFVRRGDEVAFGTIVAGGSRAATLHYVNCDQRLKKGDMLLIDCGSEHNLYSADVTRVFPIGGTFSPVQKSLYQAVLKAQKAAIRTIRDGVLIKKVYDAAVRELTKGLIELGVLKGKLPALIKKQAYKPYFPHGIGHSLGLDVHDIGPLRGNKAARLQAGMIFTVEPGLYFSKAVGKLPACGVRIEDNVLVTKKGCEVLSYMIPKEIEDIETVLGF